MGVEGVGTREWDKMSEWRQYREGGEMREWGRLWGCGKSVIIKYHTSDIHVTCVSQHFSLLQHSDCPITSHYCFVKSHIIISFHYEELRYRSRQLGEHCWRSLCLAKSGKQYWSPLFKSILVNNIGRYCSGLYCSGLSLYRNYEANKKWVSRIEACKTKAVLPPSDGNTTFSCPHCNSCFRAWIGLFIHPPIAFQDCRMTHYAPYSPAMD